MHTFSYFLGFIRWAMDGARDLPGPLLFSSSIGNPMTVLRIGTSWFSPLRRKKYQKRARSIWRSTADEHDGQEVSLKNAAPRVDVQQVEGTMLQVPFRHASDNTKNPVILVDLSCTAREGMTLFDILHWKISDRRSFLIYTSERVDLRLRRPGSETCQSTICSLSK
jgi:hypothetical protein